MNLQIEYRSVSSLKEYARNARTHSAAQVTQIANSIREFGFNNPILIDGNGEIIAGHGRVLAAAKVGMAEVPCIVLGHLSERQKRAYVLADNKLGLNSAWDFAKLADELSDLAELDFDLSLTGFDEQELDAFLKDTESILPSTYEVIYAPPPEPLEAEKPTPKLEPAEQPKPEPKAEPVPSVAYTPNYEPEVATNEVSEKEINATRQKLAEQFNKSNPMLEVVCPQCTHTFYIDK